MIGLKLAVEQGEPALPQSRDKPCQCHFRGISFARDHAFAKKCPPQRKAVKPTGQPIAHPAFHRMGIAALVQLGEDRFDLPADPGFGPVVRRLRAKCDHLFKCGVSGHPEPIAYYRFFK